MAETAVGLVVDHLIPLLTQEGRLLTAVHSHVLDIKRELQSIQCFLRDADWRVETEGDGTSRSDGVKVWVEQVRDLAFQIEDVIDDYTLYLSKHPRQDGLVGFLRKIGRAIQVKPRYKIASQVRDIKATVLEIKERSARYGFDSLRFHRQQQEDLCLPAMGNRLLDPLFMDEAQVVGLESDRDKLIRWLVDESPDCTVVALVGMGGVGKTTLAKCVYDSVITQFDCHAWVTVSRSYDINEVLQSLMDKFFPKRMSRCARTGGIDVQRQNISKIREFLKNKRYIIVFDDVWREDFWIHIKHALLVKKMGGRIVITTRNLDVPRFCERKFHVHVNIHELQTLPPEQAWQLFCNEASQFDLWQSFRPTIEDYAGKIVSRCQGLRLAILTVAGLLSMTETVDEWRKLHDNLRFEMESNPRLTSIMKILSLSYNEMPHYLKSCFLYLGMYPEGQLINCSRLIRQWVSEGFITPKMNITLEQVAEEYLKELINTSLVQASRVNFRGEVKECRVHDLVHGMILKKARHLQFGNYFSQYAGSFAEPGRRLSIGNTSLDVLGTLKDSRVRSILIFNKLHGIPGSLNTNFVANFKYLKLLDFEYASVVAHLPQDIGSLFHLRYWSVAHTKVRQLPRSIGKLQNLMTLDLKWSLVHNLPVEINRLHKLRHLLAYRIDTQTDNFLAKEGGVKIRKGIGGLASLQKLYYIESNNEIMAELRKLRQLRKLGIMELKSADGRTLCECINKMKNLESLRVSTVSEDEIINLDSLPSATSSVESLFLKGRLENFAEWINRFIAVRKLEIVGSRLEYIPGIVFHSLRNLVMLKLSHHSYDGERLYFKEGMFQRLRYLYFQRLSRLNSLVIERGAMFFLEGLSIEDCCQLKEVPRGLQHLKFLKMISLVDMPEEFTTSVKPGGQHFQIVQHVSEVVSAREVYDLPSQEAPTSGSH